MQIINSSISANAGRPVVGKFENGEFERGGEVGRLRASFMQAGNDFFDWPKSHTADGESRVSLIGPKGISGDIPAGDAGDGFDLNFGLFGALEVDQVSALQASGSGGDIGPGVAAEAGETDDFAGDTTTTGRLTVGGTVTGELETVYDRDWFRITLEEGHVYRFDLKIDGSAEAPLRDPFLNLLDADGQYLRGDDDSGVGLESRFIYRPDSDGFFYLNARGYSTNTGSYILSASEPVDDYLESTATNGRLSVGGAVDGGIDYEGDRDWFRITLEEGQAYRFDLQGVATGRGSPSTWLALRDADGTRLLLGSDVNNDGDSRIGFTAEADGFFYLDVRNNYGRLGTYSLSVQELEDDFAGNAGTTGRLNVGGSASGEIELPWDRDWFRITLEDGHDYRFDLAADGLAEEPLSYPILALKDADGQFLLRNYYMGSRDDGTIRYTAESDGFYYLKARGNHSKTGSYTLNAVELIDDYTADATTTGRLETGGTVSGEIAMPWDRDWIRITLEDGHDYRFVLAADTLAEEPLYNPILAVKDTDGDFVLRSYHSGTRGVATVYYTAEADGFYYLKARGYKKELGSWTLDAVELIDDYTADATTAGRLEVGGTVSGEIAMPWDRDWIRITLEDGHDYRFDLAGDTLAEDALYNPILAVKDTDGDFVLRSYFSGSRDVATVFYTAEADGFYYLKARGYKKELGSWTLDAVELIDDFTADATTAGRLEVGGTVSGEIAMPWDRDWIRITLEEGHDYRFDLAGDSLAEDALYNPILAVKDTDGDFVLRSYFDGSRDAVSAFYTAETDGFFYLKVRGYKKEVGSWTLDAAEVIDDFSGDATTTGRLEPGGTVTGEIGMPMDRDWFRITLEEGQTYMFIATGQSVGQGRLSHPLLTIRDADGAVLMEDDGSVLSRTSQLEYTAESDGFFYLDAHGYLAETGSYSLSGREVIKDVGGDIGTSGRLAVGDSVLGEIMPSPDEDWYRITLEEGHLYEFDLEGSAGDGVELRDPYLYLYDENGDLLDYNDDGGPGLDSLLLYSPGADGDYYLAAASYGHYGRGTFLLSAREIIVEEGSGAWDGSGQVDGDFMFL